MMWQNKFNYISGTSIQQTKRAFTLIEVLVVVAIIALLAAILIPSLQRAREQAKIVICKANSRQIGTIMSTYQAEFKGHVPVVFNYGAEEMLHGSNKHFAQNSYLSVAFRSYDTGTRNLANVPVLPKTILLLEQGESEFFKPNELWPMARRKDYETRLMPDYYACPFGREKGEARFDDLGNHQIYGGTFRLHELGGHINGYTTWLAEGRCIKNLIPPIGNGRFPKAPGPEVKGLFDGRPKYSILSWSYAKLSGDHYYKDLPNSPPPEFISWDKRMDEGSRILTSHRKWTANDAQRQFAAGLSDVTVIFCMLGQWTGFSSNYSDHHIQIHNLNSHRTGQGGGNNAVFADTHVEWVKGTNIGWQ